jgi:hypothetical protein
MAVSRPFDPTYSRKNPLPILVRALRHWKLEAGLMARYVRLVFEGSKVPLSELRYPAVSFFATV